MQNNTQWENPRISPRDHPGIISIQSDAGGELPEEDAWEALEDFCERMNDRFTNSQMSTEEAMSVYELLYASGVLFNEPVGMPDPELPITEESMDSFMQRVALQKITEESFYIFYLKRGCGFTYFYGQFTLPDSPVRLSLNPIEVWRASVPC